MSERRAYVEQSAIIGIGTAVPAYRLDQRDASFRLKEALKEDPDLAKWTTRIFTQGGVESRYTCEPDLLEPAELCRYISVSSPDLVPKTEERMAVYRKEALPLALAAAKRALLDGRVRPGEITHLIAVSCTGMYLPGLDAELAWGLDLRAEAMRIPYTFLGCAAGLTAIREAVRIVGQNRDAKVLVVAVELCSIHIQPSFDREDLFSAALFGDGASACVVAASDGSRKDVFELLQSSVMMLPSSSELMQWSIGNTGFRLRLSPKIPGLIAEHVPSAIRAFWGEAGLPSLWAIHPGGRGIIDSVQKAMSLSDSQAEASRTVLRDYGNMSSATILFVLDEIRRKASRQPGDQAEEEGIAIAFGPGVAAEFIRFRYKP